MPSDTRKQRCVNLDWLNVAFLEPANMPLSLENLRRQGLNVVSRGFGTPVFAEVLILKQNGMPFLEIRRNPYSKKSEGGIFNPRLIHVRLDNRACYLENPIAELRKFVLAFNCEYVGVSRVDICCDFNTFDNGTNPANFVLRYMRAEVSKINQCNLAAHGKDNWSGRTFNSLKWGSSTSMITTKLYNKTLEMQQNKEKPYIIEQWKAAGLDLTKPIWRVEFSIKAEGRHMVSTDGEYFELGLTTIDNRQKMWYLFAGLAQKYFHFKKVEYIGDKPKRKDRCADVLLFRYAADIPVYQPIRMTAKMAPDRTDKILLRRLQRYQEQAAWERGPYHQAITDTIVYLKHHYDFDMTLATAVQ